VNSAVILSPVFQLSRAPPVAPGRYELAAVAWHPGWSSRRWTWTSRRRSYMWSTGSHSVRLPPSTPTCMSTANNRAYCYSKIRFVV